MVAMVTSPSFLGGWNILPFLFLYLCIHAHHHQKLMSDNQLCDKDALCLHVQQFSSQLEKPQSGSILIHSAAQRRLPSRCRSHPTDRNCCSLTTQRSGPSVCRNVDRLENHQPHHKGAPHPPLAHHSEPWCPNRKRFVGRLVLYRHFMLLVPLVTI